MTLLPPDPFEGAFGFDEPEDFGIVGVGFDDVRLHPDFKRVRRTLKITLPRKLEAPSGLVYVPIQTTPVAPGAVLEHYVCPMLVIGPPYWLGLRDAHCWNLRRLMFGQEVPAMCAGDLPAELLELEPGREWPDGLVPISARVLGLGHRITLEVLNRSVNARALEGGLWATPAPTAAPYYGPPRRVLERERALPLARLDDFAPVREQITAERRAELERERLALLEPFEDGDSWESPTWEE